MLRTLWTAKSGMNANQERLDCISNNLANSETIGYKKTNVSFQDLLTESLDRKGVPINNKNSYIGTGIRAGDWNRNNQQGPLSQTLRSTDIAIDGSGYYKVVDGTGASLYTRDGSFAIDGLGRLVDDNGNKLSIEYNEGFSEENVQFKKDNFLIEKDGSISLKNNDKFLKIGRIPVYDAIGDNAFVSVGQNLYKPMPGVDVLKSNNVDLYQGFSEGSNVDIAEEFADMIVTQRSFELNSRGIKTADEMWGMINNLRSR